MSSPLSYAVQFGSVASLKGWQTDNSAAAWPAFLQSCRQLIKREPWQAVCSAANQLNIDKFRPQDKLIAKAFFQCWFKPQPLTTTSSDSGLITGYYEPVLVGSLTPSAQYTYPIYGKPNDLLRVDKKQRARLVNEQNQPYLTRQQIDGSERPLAGNEILWLRDAVDGFFLHVQGSGRVKLPSGELVGVAFADHNGHEYRSIGKYLIDIGAMQRKDVTLFSLKQWLYTNTEQRQHIFNYNPRYIFFHITRGAQVGAVGSLNVPLTPRRSLAMDPNAIEPGSPVWLDTIHPVSGQAMQRLMMVQDTGAAIKGEIRADVFWGSGKVAERAAGQMKALGKLTQFIPQTCQTPSVYSGIHKQTTEYSTSPTLYSTPER